MLTRVGELRVCLRYVSHALNKVHGQSWAILDRSVCYVGYHMFETFSSECSSREKRTCEHLLVF